MRNLGPLFADAWRLFKPYFFRSEQRWAACGMLALIIALNVVQTELGVLLSFWRNHWYNSLQEKNWDAFIALTFTWYKLDSGWIMPGFIALATVLVLMGIVTLYLTQLLQIRWRSWMTGAFLERWLADRAYYRISVTADPSGTATDNPDQRISDDMAQFCGAGANAKPGEDTMSIGLDFLTNIVSLVSFLVVLWSVSGAFTLFGVEIPGFLVWVALIYALIGTYLTHLVGRRLIPLRFVQQRLEANFRFGLVRVRENTEGIALYNGEREERAALAGRFDAVRVNFLALLRRTCGLNFVTGGYNQAAVVFPFIVASPRYFAGLIPLGTLIQISESFGQVQGSLSWIVNNYPVLANWRAAVARLATFDRAIDQARAAERGGVHIEQALHAVGGAGGGIALDDLDLRLPDGTKLLDHEQLELPSGVATVISGRSGSGKSTLFRALAGIWPFGSGEIRRPAGKYLFLPQKPYIPLGTLRHAIAYPEASDAFEPARVEAALRDAGLARLIPELDTEENWSQRLSGGEQQRLAIARALLTRPDWLFLDEATASLDPEAEDALYTVLRAQLPHTTIVSIAHRPNVAAYHDAKLVFRREEGRAGSLAAA